MLASIWVYFDQELFVRIRGIGKKCVVLTVGLAWGSLVVMAGPMAGQTAEYLDFDALTSELQDLANGSNLASISSIATSHDGRDIWVVQIAAPGGVPVGSRPAVLVVGNLEGDHVVGSQLALETIRYLLDGGAEVSSALEDHVFYIVPRLNPDGAEGMFASVLADRRTNALSFDDDNDGRLDEDGAEDLNGDGMITLMRVADPLGGYAIDDEDNRLMVTPDAAQRRVGQYTLYWEGIDNDGDGFINEDGPGGVDLNRNFQHEYPYYGNAAGPHMVSEPESRGLMDFVISHRNIAAILTFGHSDNLVTPPTSGGVLADPTWFALNGFADAANSGMFGVGVFASGTATGGLRLRGAQPGADNDPASGRRPSVIVDGDDVEYFQAVSEAYREITGIEAVGASRRAEGAFFQYGYYQFGVPSFSTQGWGFASPDDDLDGDAALLGLAEAGGIDAFVPWTEFEHPDLGTVEIGGFRPYALTNPPAAQLPELGRAQGEFVVRLASMLSRISLVSTDVESHGGGLFTVTVEVANTGFLPSSLRHGVVSGAVAPVTVQIQVDAEDILTGSPKTSQINTLAGSGTRARFSWLIRGREGSTVEIQARSQKSGGDTVTVTLGGNR